jgi:hypothetical protein
MRYMANVGTSNLIGGAHVALTCNKTTLALLRVIGGWILAVGSFIVAIAVTAEFFADPDPGPAEHPRSYLIEVKPTDAKP